jgi:hypothetical protein
MVFEVWVDDAESCTQRSCVSSGKAAFIGYSEGTRPEAEPDQARCPSGQARCEVGVGFSFRANDTAEVKWIISGFRCIRHRVVGNPADWKIDYAPADHLLASA